MYVKEDFLSVTDNRTIIDRQQEKEELSDSLLSRGEKLLLFLSRLPFIRYIGVSGSVAARNPTLQYSKRGKSYVDLDLFVITRSNCLWPLFLLERLLTNAIKIVKGYHFYCFNYVTDESFLEVYNKNFFTATEMTNLKTVYDDGVFASFIEKNMWSEKYYPKIVTSGTQESHAKPFLLRVLAPVNFLCFGLFCVGRAIKRVEIAPVFELFGGFNPLHKCNLRRISNPNGGYQEAVKKRFIEIFEDKFPMYYSEEIMDDLFPPSNAFTFTPKRNVHDRENAELFSKYTLSANEENSI